MAVFLALLSAATLGTADFLGGLGVRAAHPGVVVLWSNAAGLPLAVAGSVWMGSSSAVHEDALWGLAAGLTGPLSAGLLYWALAHGRAVLVAPTAAAVTAAVPVLVGMCMGDPMTARLGMAFPLALAAVALVSVADENRSRRSRAGWAPSALLASVGAGTFCGAFLVFLSLASHGAGLWSLVVAKVTAIALLVVAVRSRGLSLLAPRGAILPTAANGVLDMSANMLFLLAVRAGHLSVIGLLTSVYPVPTVALSALVSGERMRRMQYVGIGCAVASIALFTVR